MVAGEASGDLHGAHLLRELRGRAGQHGHEIEAWGLGSDQMSSEGFDALADSREIAVVGIAEVARILRSAKRIFDALLERAEAKRPDAAILIDAPDFNLRLARKLTRMGVPVFYYISPQVWAWRKRRVHAIARDVHHMLVLFPFEAEFYERHDVRVTHVGHPLVDQVPVLPPRLEGNSETEQRSASEELRLVLLPGSRDSEVRALFPPMLEAVARLAKDQAVSAVLVRAPSVSEALVEKLLGQHTALARERDAGRLDWRVEENDRFRAIRAADLAICASGTATLEVGMCETPMVVVYRVAASTYLLARLLVDLPHISLVNLVLGRGVVPELLQGEASGPRIASEVRRLTTTPGALAEITTALRQVRGALGESGASGRAAEVILDDLAQVSSAPGSI